MTTTGTRGTEVELLVKLVIEECCNCGVVFAMTRELRDRRQGDKQSFYCPNGHGQSYTGKSKADLERELKDARRDTEWYQQAERTARDRAALAERQNAARKGAITKMRKRAEAGACPFGCKRHFLNLERHVARQHAGQELPGEADVA